MIVEERNGRYYAVHPGRDQDAKGKAMGQEAECEVPVELVGILRLDYVTDYDPENDSIKYSDEFYPNLFKELEAGKTDTEAYEALGFSVQVLGRFRAINACKRAREKARLAKVREGLPPGAGDIAPELEQYRGHTYVRQISGNKIFYKEEFYEEFSKRLDEGLSALEAYKALGFDPEILGAQRAYKAADRAKEWKERKAEGPMYKVGDFSGAVPLAKMMEEAGDPDVSSEWLARLLGRVIYLETTMEALKKKPVEIFGTTYEVEGRLEELDMVQVADKFIKYQGALMERFQMNQAGTLRVFDVKASTYNGLVKRQEELADPNSQRAKKLAAQREKDNEIKLMIIKIVKDRNGCVPGHRTMQLELLIRYHKYLSIKSIRYYKQKMHLVTDWGKKPYKGQDTYRHPMVSPGNLVVRCFYMGFRVVILVDITYFKYDLGRKVCYHIEFYDPFMDKVLGMATSDSLSVEFVKEAYEKMLAEHGSEFCNPGVYVHSDNGSQLLETSFTEMIHVNGFIRSVSRPGTPGDNRPMEAKFSRLKGTLKEKLLLCKTTDQVREVIEGCIKDHEENDHCTSLGGLTPNQFEQYFLTGIYPLDSYYDVSADELHPINALITKMKENAHKRTERSKKEKAEHAEKLELIRQLQKVNPASVIERDRATILEEKARCLKGKHSLDTDLKLLEVVDEKLAVAISFIRKATPDVLEKLKDCENWKDYPELQYINDFPQHKDGKLIFDREKLTEGLTTPATLWLAVEDFLTGVIDFFDKASPSTRKLLEDPKNWGSFPELSFLNLYPINERLVLEEGAGI